MDDDEKDELIAELIKLRRRQGMTKAKVGEAMRLCQLLGLDANESYGLIIDTLNGMNPSKHVRAARNALGVGWDDPLTLEKRRIEFLGTEEINDMSTVIDWEHQGFKELVAWLDSTQKKPTAHKVVAAFIDGLHVTQIQEFISDDNGNKRAGTHRLIENHDRHTTPTLIYQAQQEDLNRELRLTLYFKKSERMPYRVVSFCASNLYDITFMPHALTVTIHETELPHGYSAVAIGAFDAMEPGYYYGLAWFYV